MSDCFSKTEYFQKSLELLWSVLVHSKCLWLGFSELFEERQCRLVNWLITVTHKKDVSVQVILFPPNDVLRISLTFFGIESKKSTWTMLILSILTFHGTFDISLQRWLLIRSKIFPNFSNRKAPSYWQNLISFNHLFSYNH